MIAKNIFAGIPPALREEYVDILVRTGSGRIERIVSRGQCSPPGFWYDQVESEWVLLVRGEARLSIEGQKESVALRPGDWLDIPAGTRHRVDWTAPDEDTVWLAVFY